MQKIKTSIDKLLDDIKNFYDYKKFHFLTVNGIDLGDNKLELQWIFSKYKAVDEIVIFYTIIDYVTKVKSLKGIIPSAYLSEMEIVDMFGIDIEGVENGLYLDKDSLKTPLKND